MIHSVHFSLSQAQGLVPLIVPKLEKLRELKVELDAKGYNIWHQSYIGGGTNGTSMHPPQWDEFLAIAQNIQDQGIVIKDPERGLIDFPTIRSNGEEVYLCFMLGEENISWWHSIEGGFRGRRGLEEL